MALSIDIVIVVLPVSGLLLWEGIPYKLNDNI
jgi:hypothetical protein